MKKLALGLISAVLAASCVLAAACTGTASYVANDATDLPQEDFGVALKKGDADMVAAVNAVVDEWLDNGTMDKYFSYYTDLYAAETEGSAAPAVPTGLKVTWDLSGYTETLKMYTESGFAPYEFTSTSGYPVSDGSALEGAYSVAGIDVAIACQVAENLHCKLEIYDVLFDTIITNLNSASGKALAAAGLSITAERAKEVDFSNMYSSSTLTIVCAQEDPEAPADGYHEYHSLGELNGLKIGVQEGTSGDLIATAAAGENGYNLTETDDEGNEVVTGNIKLTGSEVVPYKTYAAALAALKAGKIDVIFMDKVPAQLLIANA